jgi:hypothetical protein
MKAPLASARLVFALAMSVAAGTASAETLPLTLTWTAPPPPQCPTADEVRREVARQAHAAPGRAPAPLDADARVEAIGGRWRVELHTARAGVDGFQTLEDDSCELLARATALVIALSLYDSGGSAPPSTVAPDEPRVESTLRRRPSPPAERAKPAPEPPPTSAPEQDRAAPPPSSPPDLAPSPAPTLAVSPTPTPHPTLAWAVAAEGRLSRGPLPETSFGLSLGVDARRGRLLVKVRLTGGPATEQASAAAPDVRGRYQAWGASIAPCIVARSAARLALAGCVDLDASLLWVTASGAAHDESAFAPWYAAGPVALARVRLSRLTRLELGGGVGISVDRPIFALRHLVEVYAVPRFVPNATIGVSVDL